MKKLIATSIALISATAATAGSVIYTPPTATALEAPERMGSSGAWITRSSLQPWFFWPLPSKKMHRQTVAFN
ncbi:MAG TPA: hypothetical protein EYG79_13815 [Rhodobacteraceae bacterium]|nr:hypothetical protein [Paracoccaceae bacterium]